MKLQITPTRKGLVAIYRQKIIQDVTLFTSQSAAMFYDKLFSSLDFTLPRAATGRRGFPKEAMVCAFIVMKCEGFSQITDLMDYLDNSALKPIMAKLVRKLYELGLVYMRFFSLPGDPRFFILCALLF